MPHWPPGTRPALPGALRFLSICWGLHGSQFLGGSRDRWVREGLAARCSGPVLGARGGPEQVGA